MDPLVGLLRQGADDLAQGVGREGRAGAVGRQVQAHSVVLGKRRVRRGPWSGRAERMRAVLREVLPNRWREPVQRSAVRALENVTERGPARR
ncbi:hypothetical protein GCM10010495_01300 [Kitasatospora herbaricolor]|nr:hypothetical protein GCM10010495_01300 [Kitasatospora herbaricolor]